MNKPFMAPVIVFAAVFLILALMVTLAPSVAYDSLRWHLPAARHYAAEHVLAPVPHMDYSVQPQAVEILMTLAHAAAGQPAAQMVNPTFFALTLLLAYAVARRCRIDPMAAVAGVVFAAAIPFLHWTGSIAKNDFALGVCPTERKSTFFRQYLVFASMPDHNRLGVKFSVGQTPSVFSTGRTALLSPGSNFGQQQLVASRRLFPRHELWRQIYGPLRGDSSRAPQPPLAVEAPWIVESGGSTRSDIPMFQLDVAY